MKWQEVRLNHPNRWLLVEAARAHSEADRRILDDLVVLDTYDDSAVAMRKYAQMHRQRPDRELYVLHTSREEVKVEERRWFGIRAGALSCGSLGV
jgi:hypothetical protein